MNYRSGRPAQDEFKLLCSQAGVTCNSSVEDDHGWDFIVEFAAKAETHQPLDKIPGPRQALVQVKSTQGQSLRIRMKVSNALKLAKSELPCFVILFQYDASNKPRIYVRHYWTDLIRLALRRGRETSAANKQAHKMTMEISFSNEDDHTDEVIDWMVAALEETSVEYGAKKRSLYETLGYEGQNNYRATVTFAPLNGIEEIVDHQLGLTDYLPVSNLTVMDCRFGIEAPVPVLDNMSGQAQLRPNNARECKVIFQNLSGDVASFEATMRAPALPDLPADKFKILVQTWCFNISILQGGGTLQFRELWDEELSIERLVELSQFLSWSEEPMTMKIMGTDLPPLNCQGQFSSSGHARHFATLLNAAKMLQEIQVRAMATRHTFRELQIALRELSIFHAFLTENYLRLRAPWDPSLRSDVYLSRIMGYFDFQVGEFTYFAVFDASVTGPATEEDGIRLDCGPRLLRECLVGTDSESVRTAGTKSFDREAALHGDECLAFGNLRVLLQIDPDLGKEDV